MAKRVLLVTPYFLPRRRVGSMRPFRFAIHLHEFGWEPTVLTIATPGQELTDKEARLLRHVNVVRIEAPIDRTAHSESQLGMPPKQGKAAPRSHRSRILDVLDRQFPVDTWLPLFVLRFRMIARMAVHLDPHVIWATGDPWSGLVLGRWLSSHCQKPYVADFRDPWTLSEVRTEGKWTISKMMDRRSERRIVESADLIMFQAQRVEAAYREHYAQLEPTTVTIRNSFDAEVFDDPIQIKGSAPLNRDGNLHIGFFGRFRSMSPATLMVDVLAEMRSRDAARAKRVIVHSFGPLTSDDAEYARRHGVESQFVAHDAVPLQKSLSVLRRFDILLVSTDPRRQDIIPAKIFEYLPAGRPILSLSRNAEVAEILDRTRTGMQMQDTTAIADLLGRCVEAAARREPLPIFFDPQPGEIMKYEARTSTGEFARVLDTLIGQQAGTSSSTE